MAYNEELAVRIRKALEGNEGITEKKMFGGLGFMVNGNMCCGVVKDDLMIRVGPENHQSSLALPYARPMDFTGRPMKGFVYVTDQGINDDNALTEWVNRGVAFAQSLPAK